MKRKLLVASGITVGVIPLFLLMAGGFRYVDDPSLEQTVTRDSSPRHSSSESVVLNPDNNLYFGDLHIHTAYSTDAYVMGVRTLPEHAYTYATGGVIEHGSGYEIQAARPLDFAAVTDHGEYLGMMRGSKPDLPLEKRGLKDILQNDNRLSISLAYLKTTLHIARNYFEPDIIDQDLSNAAWQDTIDMAERFYEPGKFTTFIAYEWSSQPGGSNLHRNVIYRGNREQVPDGPYSALNSEDPFDLLMELKRQDEGGYRVLAIPHNGNLSNGLMYGEKDFRGQAMDKALAGLRNRYEPLSEIFQVKGSSETHPILSALDEFADFEIFESNMTAFGEVAPPAGGYTRDALRTGMEMSHRRGFNPYEFGVIGASDSHNASSPVEENNFHGKLPMMDGAASLRMNEALLLPDGLNRAMQWGSGGLAGVWAPENTREAIFDAMQRKETFATSGPRIRVRFFAGWHFAGNLHKKRDAVSIAYRTGVAMGGKLLRPDGEHVGELSPVFFVQAAKDPDGANLDRIQITKLWVDPHGESHEKIFNVAASDDRDSVGGNKLPPVGNTVNVKQATYTNTIGASQLQTVWTDPEFDMKLQASYYARVLEIPTPRWSTYDAKTLDIEALDPASIQERAVTSAIWYRP